MNVLDCHQTLTSLRVRFAQQDLFLDKNFSNIAHQAIHLEGNDNAEFSFP